jgi:hypothetical protein
MSKSKKARILTVRSLWSFVSLVTFISAEPQAVHASAIELTDAKGIIYEAYTSPPNPLFNYLRTVTTSEGITKAVARFIDLSGELVFTETTITNQGKIHRYEWEHHLMKESGTVEVKGGKVQYTIRRGDPVSEETGSKDASENLVVGLSIVTTIQNHWRNLEAGKSLKLRLGVPDRMDDFGFILEKKEDQTNSDNKSTLLLLSPSSFFVSLAVKPIEFVFSKDGTKLLRLRGISPIKIKRSGKWTDVIADSFFTYR